MEHKEFFWDSVKFGAVNATRFWDTWLVWFLSRIAFVLLSVGFLAFLSFLARNIALIIGGFIGPLSMSLFMICSFVFWWPCISHLR